LSPEISISPETPTDTPAPAGGRPNVGLLAFILSARHDHGARIFNTDLAAAGIALLLPWSTTGTIILIGLWLVAVSFTLDVKLLADSFKRPFNFWPLALVAIAIVGTLWSEANWGARLYAVSPVGKFLVLPFAFYHFARTERGPLIFKMFLVSCALQMAASWIVFFAPSLSLRQDAYEPGVFVKNYIDQSQEFALCVMGMLFPIASFLRARRYAGAALLMALAASFVINMAFVVVSRTALVAMPIMLGVFVLMHLRWRGIMIVLAATILLGAVGWTASPALRAVVASSLRQYDLYETVNEPTSIGLRIEYWRKSIRFFQQAPLIGHGTGSIEPLFEQAARSTTDKTRAAADVTRNPHNQTLNVAVQWGLLGVAILYALWFAHWRLFRGDDLAGWIGLMVVIQNIIGSLFNSHLFDFTEGWIYVFGVGIAGGMVMRARRGSGAQRDLRRLATA